MTKHRPPAVKAGDFPALEDFLAAYLHQDFRDEHASPEAALAAYLDEASKDDVTKLTHDWRAFQRRVRTLADAARVQLFVRTLGSAWVPRRFAEVEALFARLL